MADHLAVLNMPMQSLRRSATVTSFEPLTLLSALAMATERIGLMATASTTFDEPYHIARRFASLDHITILRPDSRPVQRRHIALRLRGRRPNSGHDTVAPLMFGRVKGFVGDF
jgi:hypothetical protein